eukprot:TRINITY_DN67966_c1_g1_i5.p1 TRINITY_DN67966_c1_g1~~TRINITY_DN67966_c1_g1_i5.p1  ORF type:complete len:170 (+),score=9.27 TRINITY_DN67966_c1_g1_i5:702-1211(+)
MKQHGTVNAGLDRPVLTTKGHRAFEMPKLIHGYLEWLNNLSATDFTPSQGWMGTQTEIARMKGLIQSSLTAFATCWEEKFSPWTEPPLVWAGLLDPKDPGVAARLLQRFQDCTGPFGQSWTLQPDCLNKVLAGESLWVVDKKLAAEILQCFMPLKIGGKCISGAEGMFN